MCLMQSTYIHASGKFKHFVPLPKSVVRMVIKRMESRVISGLLLIYKRVEKLGGELWKR